MRFAGHSILAACLLMTGCATHAPTGPTAPASTIASVPTTAINDSRAALTLDQIRPVPELSAPATQPSPATPPLDALVLYAKARVAEDMNRRIEAIAFLRQAAKLDPASFDVQSELARLYITADSAGEQAADALQRAASLKPDDLQTQNDLGRVYLARGDIGRATEHFRLALQTTDYRADDDSSAITDYYLARSLQKQGYDRAALDEYTRLLGRLEHGPESVRGNPDLDYWLARPDLLYAEVGRLHEKQGEPQAALAAYEVVAQHAPDDLDTQARIVRLLIQVGRRDEAAHQAIDAVARTHASEPSLQMLHAVYRGDDGSAIGAMRRLFNQHPQDRPVLFALADLLTADGQGAEAQRILSNVAATTTDTNGAGDTQVLRKLFGELIDAGNTAEAARLLVNTSARRPDTVDEMMPMWIELVSTTRRGRLRDSQLAALPVAKSAEAARSYWVARLAISRPALLASALDDSIRRDPPFAPAFRFALSRILTDDSLKPDQRQQKVDDLVATASKRGLPGLAQELLGTALLSNAESSKLSNDSAGAQELAEAAQNALNEASKLGDNSPNARIRAADAMLLTSDSANYERLMWKLVSDRPNDDEAYNKLFRFYEQQGQAERSVAVSQNWLLADPTDPAARLLRILLLSKAGVADEAERMLMELYKERPDDPDVLDSMRLVLSQIHGSSDRFVSILESRVAQHPDDLSAVEQLVNDYARQNRDADAVRLIDAARNAVLTDSDMLYFTAHLYERVGAKDSHRDASVKTLEMALTIDRDNAGVNNDLGYTFADEGKNLSQAEAMIRHAVELEPDNGAYLDSLGWVLYKRGRFADARSYLEKAILPESQADPVVLNHLGDDLYRLGASDDAKHRWQTALDRLDERLKQSTIEGEPTDTEAAAVKVDLEAKLKELQAGGPVNVAPVVETMMKQAQK